MGAMETQALGVWHGPNRDFIRNPKRTTFIALCRIIVERRPIPRNSLASSLANLGGLTFGAKALSRPTMISKRWHGPIIYSLMSAFIAWHCLAMVIGPAPKSYIADTARAIFRPYLELFGFNNPWDFYAPRIGYGHQFHYVIEDTVGKSHDFSPTDELSWFHPSFWWFRAWYETIGDFPGLLGPSFVKLVCKKHEFTASGFGNVDEGRTETFHIARFPEWPSTARPRIRHRKKSWQRQMSRALTFTQIARNALDDLNRAWSRLWFQSRPDNAIRNCTDRDRRRAIYQLCAGNSLSSRFLGRRRIAASHNCL